MGVNLINLEEVAEQHEENVRMVDRDFDLNVPVQENEEHGREETREIDLMLGVGILSQESDPFN